MDAWIVLVMRIGMLNTIANTPRVQLQGFPLLAVIIVRVRSSIIT